MVGPRDFHCVGCGGLGGGLGSQTFYLRQIHFAEGVLVVVLDSICVAIR